MLYAPLWTPSEPALKKQFYYFCFYSIPTQVFLICNMLLIWPILLTRTEPKLAELKKMLHWIFLSEQKIGNIFQSFYVSNLKMFFEKVPCSLQPCFFKSWNMLSVSLQSIPLIMIAIDASGASYCHEYEAAFFDVIINWMTCTDR